MTARVANGEITSDQVHDDYLLWNIRWVANMESRRCLKSLIRTVAVNNVGMASNTLLSTNDNPYTHPIDISLIPPLP